MANTNKNGLPQQNNPYQNQPMGGNQQNNERKVQFIDEQPDPLAYRKKDISEADIEKTSLFVEKLSQYIKDEGFQGFEMESNVINEGWFDEQAFIDVLEKKYGIKTNQDMKQCIYYLTNKNPKGIHIDELRTKLRVSANYIGGIQEDTVELSKNFGLKSKAQKVSYQVNPALAVQLRDNIKQIFPNPQTLLDVFFDPNLKPPKPTLTLTDFSQIIERLYQRMEAKQSNKQPPQQKDIENLFYYLDVNQGDSVSLSEFKQRMCSEQELEILKQKQDVRFTKSMDEQIVQLFKKCDQDNSGFLEIEEIKKVLSTIGVNCGEAEVQRYMNRFDQNGDGKISLEEFKIIMEERLKNEMLAASDMQETIRINFQKADVNKVGYLDRKQLSQVFQNLGANLNPQEFEAVFTEVDQDLSGTVDIDEMMHFLLKNSDNLSGLASAAVLNIRSSRSLSLNDLRAIFDGMPSNFRSSFVRAILKNGTNLPAQAIKPKLDTNQQYTNIQIVPQKDQDKSFLNREYYKNLKNVKYIEFKLEKATGVPIPNPSQIPRINLKHREIYFGLFDSNTNEFVGNIVRVAAEWKQESEDVWEFMPGKKSFNTIVLKLSDYNEQKYSNLSICFELIVHYEPANKTETYKKLEQDVEMSCSYGQITIQDLMKTGSKSINLKGGEPSKQLEISKDDVRTERKGLMGALSTKFSKITTSLKLNVNKVEQTNQDMMVLPKTILMPKYVVPLYIDFTEYFAFRTLRDGNTINTMLINDNNMKTFQKIVNCPDTFDKFAVFWLDEVKENIKGKGLKMMYQALDKCLIHFYLLFSNSLMKFNNADPSASCKCFKNLQDTRNQLVDAAINDLRFLILKKGQGGNMKVDPSPQPFNLNEILEDDDDDIQMFEKFYTSKIGLSLKGEKIQD